MKKLSLLIFVILFASCQKSELPDTNVDSTTEEFLLQTPKSGLENSNLGLYHGVVVSYDLSVHGEIIISLKNDGSLRAVAKLLDGSSMEFKGKQLSKTEFIFEGKRGSFEFTTNDSNIIKIENAVLDSKPGAVTVYKESPGVPGVSIAFGTYQDDSDPTFLGAWDMINNGLTETSIGGLVIENILITHTGGFVFIDETAGVYEPFTPCTLFPATQPYLLPGPPNSFINAKQQQSSFNGSVCDWSLQYATNSTATVYFDDVTCANTAPGGTFSWRGRTGTILVVSPVGGLL